MSEEIQRENFQHRNFESARTDKFRALFIASLFVIGLGCRSTDSTAIFAHCPWGDAEETKAHLENYKHIFLACIGEDHWEDQGPHKYSLHHFQATVVRTYKGDWRASERVTFVHGVDAPARTASNALAGHLMFLFTSEHTDAEIGLDTGDFCNYDPELERVLQFVYPEQSMRWRRNIWAIPGNVLPTPNAGSTKE